MIAGAMASAVSLRWTMQIKHIGRGMWSAIDDAGNRTGPVGKREDVEAWAAAQNAPSVDVPPAPEPMDQNNGVKTVDPREYADALDRAFSEPRNAVLADVRDALLKHYEPSTVEWMVRDVAPIVSDGSGDRRRKRRYRGVI